MGVTIRAGVIADAPAISKVHYDALDKYHAFYAAFFEKHPRDILPQSTAQALEDPVTRFLVAVSDEDIVVGFLRYEVLGEPKKDALKGAAVTTRLFYPKTYLKELFGEFSSQSSGVDTHYAETFQDRRHFYIKHVMVSPNHQKQGIATSLLKAVLQDSDAAYVPTVLVSSAEGMALYRHMEFQELATWRIDNEYWAKRIVEKMEEAGIDDEEGLVEMYHGVDEVETYMVRWPEGRHENIAKVQE